MRERGKGGFWDYVKDPNFFAKKLKAEALEDFWSRIKLPKSRSPETIKRMIKRLITKPPNQATETWFKRTGQAAVPHLQAALEDEAFLSKTYPGDEYGTPPAMHVLNLIDEIDPDSASRFLHRFATLENGRFRKEAARLLAIRSRDVELETVVALLDDEDEYVRSSAIRGCREAIKRNKASAKFLEGVFEAASKLLRDDRSIGTADDAAELLLTIDRDRALELLLHPPVLDAQNKHLYEIITTLNSHNISISSTRVKELLAEIKPLAAQFPWDYAYGELLLALGSTRDASAREIIDEAAGMENDKVSESASQALAMLEGIKDPFLHVAGLADTNGEAALDEHQRRYLCLSFLDFQVCNGGFHQYFANGYGSGIRDALAGMEAIGSEAGAEVVREAMALFGPEGPPVDRIECHAQLAAFSNDQDDAMEALNSRFYELIKNVRILMLRYAVKYKESFAAVDAAS